jgi:serine/threonine protein kinase
MRFAQECQVARSLNHPNIARVVDFGLDGSKPFLAMEYVKGESLADRIDRVGALPEEEAVSIATQIGKALHWVHQRGLIHRDVTPNNIVVTQGGVAKLIDLGLVKNQNSDFNLTRTRSALGTPNFTAPEQYDDAKRVDATSDVYGLAATLYTALTGQLPFDAGSILAIATIFKKKISNDLALPRSLAPQVSERVENAVCKALRANSAERQKTVLQLVEELSPPRSKEEPAPETSVRPRRRNAKTIDERDRRRRTRFAVSDVGVRCQSLDRSPGARWEGTAVNLSQTGFCIELDRSFLPGTLLQVSLGKKKVSRRGVLVRVMWVKKQSVDKWQIGCQYDQPLSEQELLDLR